LRLAVDFDEACVRLLQDDFEEPLFRLLQ